MKKHFYSFLLTLLVPIFVFCFKFNNAFCAAVALDSASQSALSSGAFANLFDCGIGFDPISISINLSSAYDRINSYLFNRYGWDIEDKIYEGVDTASLPGGFDTVVMSLSGGLYESVQEASVAGYMLFKDNVLGNYVLGKLNQASDTISDVFNNTLVKFDNNLLSKFSSIKSDLLDNDELLNMSDLKVYYGDKFNFVSSYDFASYNFTFTRPLLLYNTTNLSQNNSYYIGVCYPQSLDSSFNDFFSSGFGIGTSGTRYNFNGLSTDVGSSTIEVINGVSYIFRPLRLSYGGGSVTQVSSINPLPMTKSDVISLLQGNDIYSLDKALCYDTTSSSYASLLSLLNMLKGHFVTSDQLDSVYALLGQLTIDTVVDDGISIPSADYAQDIIDALEGVIEGILSDNEVIDDSLGGTPEPPTPDYNNTGISVPSDFPTPILNTLFDSVSLPFNFFSIFQPIFDIFGSSSGLFSLWTFIPSIILIAFIIWALH